MRKLGIARLTQALNNDDSYLIHNQLSILITEKILQTEAEERC